MPLIRNIFSPLKHQPMTLARPSHVEMRGTAVLMIWGDVPYWIIVDSELHALLTSLDGRLTLDQTLDLFKVVSPERRDIIATCRKLQECGVLTTPADVPISTKSAVEPIESVAVNLTRRCNLRCSFCYALPWLTNSRDTELSISEFCAALDQFAPALSSRAALIILGGEPLLEPEKLLALAAWARARRMAATVSTNGLLVTDEFAKAAAQVGLEVQVSLDGPDAPCHDAIRGRGVFGKVIAAVRRLRAHKVSTILNMVVHRDNLRRLEEFFDLAGQLDASEARFIPLKGIGGGRDSTILPVAHFELLQHVLTLLKRRPDLASLMGRDAVSILANTCRYSARRSSCGTGRQTVLLDADGAVYPCLNLHVPGFTIANVRDPGFDFTRTWERSTRLAQLRAYTAIDNPSGPCAACAVRFWCLGGCRGETLAATGRLDAPSPHCDDLKKTMLEMMWALAHTPQIARSTSFIC